MQARILWGTRNVPEEPAFERCSLASSEIDSSSVKSALDWWSRFLFLLSKADKNSSLFFSQDLFSSFLSHYLCFSLKTFLNFSLRPLFFPSSSFSPGHPNPQRLLGIFSPHVFLSFPSAVSLLRILLFLIPFFLFLQVKNLSDFLSQPLHHHVFLPFQLWKSTPSALEPPNTFSSPFSKVGSCLS